MHSFQLAQLDIMASASAAPVVPVLTGEVSQNLPSQTASLINLSTSLMLIPVILIVAVSLYFILNSPVATPLYEFLAENHYKKGRFLKAAKTYEKLFNFNTLIDEGQWYARMAGECYEKIKNVERAAQWYGEAREWLKKGQVYQNAGFHDKAVEAYTQGKLSTRVAMCYESSDDFISAGLVYERDLQNLHKAKKYYTKATQTLTHGRSKWCKAHLLLSSLALRTGKIEEALTHFKKAEPSLEPHLKNNIDLRQLFETLKYGLANHL